ncbi:MAG: YaiO family outer membrane beta-barrel protein [Marinifilaceae bacterium]|jgi:YaiO family outer membrane protein|nr:YaiO family outer membrane beta-barrel protein [Marinifilaceae bacterium]
MRIHFIYILFVTLSIGNYTYSQNNDKELVRIRNLSENKQYGKSIFLCDSLLKVNPDNYSLNLLLAANYLWSKEFSKGDSTLDSMLKKYHNNIELYEFKLRSALWQSKYSYCLDLCDSLNDKNIKSRNLSLIKCRALYFIDKERYNSNLKAHFEIYPTDTSVIKLYNIYLHKNILNSFGLEFNNSYANKRYEQYIHSVNMSYLHRFKNSSHELKLYSSDIVYEDENIGEKDIGLKFGLDNYLNLSAKFYLNIRYDYSSDIIFPKHFVISELYTKLFKSHELSLGYRAMYFDNNDEDELIHTYTSSVVKYYKNSRFEFRALVFNNDSNLSSSFWLKYRSYFRKTTDYIGLDIAYGYSPNYNIGYFSDYLQFDANSYYFILSYSKTLKNRFVFVVQPSYTSEEYARSKYKNMFSLNLKISYLLY